MKTIPQFELQWGAEPFALVQDTVTDLDRVRREKAEAERRRVAFEQAQVGLFDSVNNQTKGTTV